MAALLSSVATDLKSMGASLFLRLYRRNGEDNALVGDKETAKSRSIGSVDPVSDFNELLRSGLIAKGTEYTFFRLTEHVSG